MKEFIKETVIPTALDLVISATGYGKGIKLAEKLALKVAKAPKVSRAIKTIGGFIFGGAGARTYMEARRTLVPITKKEKEEAYKLPNMVQKIKTELPTDYLLMAGGTGIIYTLKGGYKISKTLAPEPFKKALNDAYNWALDKFLFGIKKEARNELWNHFGYLLSQKHLELPVLAPEVQQLVRTPEFQEYVNHYKGLLYKTLEADPRLLHLRTALDNFLEYETIRPAGQRLIDYIALENFLINYYEGNPKIREHPFYRIFSEFEKHPIYQKLLKEKTEAFIDNYKVLLESLIDQEKKNVDLYLKRIKGLENFDKLIDKNTKRLAQLAQKIEKTEDPKMIRELKKEYDFVFRNLTGLKKGRAKIEKEIAKFKSGYVEFLGTTPEVFRKTPTATLVEQIISKIPNLDAKAKSYLVRNVLRIPRTGRLTPEVKILDFIENYYEDLKFDLQPFTIYAGAFRKREFPTLGVRFLSFLRNNITPTTTPEEMRRLWEEIYFYGNITPSKAFLISLQYPKIVKNYRTILHKLKGTDYVSPVKAITERDYVRIKYADFLGLVHKGFKQALDQIAHYSTLREDIIYGSAGRTWGYIANLNGLLKFWILKFSPFHFSALSKNLLSKGADPEHWSIAFSNALGQAFFKKDSFDLMEATLNIADALETLHKRGFTDVILTVASDVAERQGLARSLGNLSLALLSKKSPEISLEALKTAHRIGDLFYEVYNIDQRFLWDGFWRTCKILSANELVNAWRKGLLSDEQLAKEIKTLNDIFGGALDWYLIPYKKAQGLRLLLFAPDWYLSLWRNFTTWLKGDTITSADFFPALTRLHLYFANILNYYYTKQDLFDYYQIDKWGVKEWLTNWRELYKIRIPFVDKTGKRRVLTFDTALIEFEPLEMIPVLPFLEILSHELVKEKNENLLTQFEKTLAHTSKEWLQYWYTKKSTILNLISQIGTLGFLFRTSDDIEFWDKLMGETFRYLVPLSFIQLFNIHGRTDRYLFLPDDRPWVRFFEALQSFAFKVRATERFADYVVHNLYNPALPDKTIEFLTNYYYLSYFPKELSDEMGLRKRRIDTERLLKDMIDGLARDISRQLVGYKINAKIKELSEKIKIGEVKIDEIDKHIVKIYEDAGIETIRALNQSYLPDDIKEKCIEQLEKIIIEKTRREIPFTIMQKAFEKEEVVYEQ